MCHVVEIVLWWIEATVFILVHRFNVSVDFDKLVKGCFTQTFLPPIIIIIKDFETIGKIKNKQRQFRT